MIEQNKDIKKKEIRRAKRKGDWLLEGNQMPLSITEITSIRNQQYRRRKLKEKQDAQKTEKLNLKYNENLFNYVNEQNYTHKGGLTYIEQVVLTSGLF